MYRIFLWVWFTSVNLNISKRTQPHQRQISRKQPNQTLQNRSNWFTKYGYLLTSTRAFTTSLSVTTFSESSAKTATRSKVHVSSRQAMLIALTPQGRVKHLLEGVATVQPTWRTLLGAGGVPVITSLVYVLSYGYPFYCPIRLPVRLMAYVK